MEIRALIRKIGHSLLEIRVRALKSIICKLDHSLLSISDVVQERMLFVLLLEWFNFPEVPLQEEVLQLLSTLSKHETGAQMLRDVGAVEFFTQLSPNLEPCLRTVVNDIVEQLFHLPDLFTACPTVCSQEQAGITSALPLEQSAPTVGYFQSSKPNQADIPPQRQAVSNVVRCLKFSTFPWLTLNTTDRHILSSNESSLRSNNHNLVRSTCELLRDVIMQDFPAEIFLQRPSIVQNLLSLLRLGPGEGEAGYLRLQAAACLQQLSVALRTRLRFHRDPSFYSAKQDPVSQNSSMSYSQDVRGTQVQRSLASSPGAECSPRPSVVGRTAQRASGDGQDGDATSSSGSSHGAGGGSQAARQTPQSPADAAQLELPDLGAEDVLELQLQQLSLPQFAVTTLEHATPLLRTDGPRVFQRVLELLRETSELLGDSICELVWDDHSLLGMELREKLQSSLAEMGEILRYHQSCPEDSPPGLLLHHRMAYVGTAVFTIRLLQTILPLEKASENLPECTAAILLPLSLDRPFSLLFPSMHEAAVAYLEQVNSDGHALYRRVARAALCMESTCAFLKEKQAEGERNWPELLELADQAVEGLPFHQHLPIIRDCLNICSDLWKIDQASPFLKTASQKVFLKLLSHPLLPVKTETYSCTLSVVKHCLGVHNKSKPGSSVCCGIHFLLHARVLYEISAFGLQDPAEKVSAAAKDILLFLLKGRLMMSAATWDRLNQAVYPVIPILQSYADTEGVLGSCVLLVSEVSEPGKDDTAPHTLRAALRLLFTKQHKVRVKAVEHLLPYLADEKDLTLSSLPSLFCLSASLDISLDSSERSFLKAESVEKLFAILTSDTVDSSLRRSAAEQLAVVLQDTAMHPVLKRLGVTDTVAAFITDGVSGDVKGPGSLLEPCMCILRKLVFADPSLRHRLARQQGLLLALLRAALLIKENGGDVREVAALMCLLLFDEIATVDSWCDTAGTSSLSPFSLPVSVLRRYNLPFQSASHHAVSPHCSVLPPSADLLALPPARHALQLAWNAAWHSGIGNLLEERSPAADFHSDLLLSEVQLLLLRATHLPSGLQDCIQAIVMAAGHRSVTSAVSRLRLYRLTDRLALTHAHTPGFRNTLPSLNWRPAIARFLQVRPACTEDERLLVDIVAFLNGHFEQRCPDSEGDDQDLCWILELLLNQETSSLLDPLLGVQPHTPARTQGELEEVRNLLQQRLQRELTSFFNTLLRCLQHTTDRRCLTMAGPFESQLAVRLLQSLRVSDAPRFYGLPSLERTLLGMVNLTAQPGWSRHSLEPHALRLKYLSGLLEVISSFYVEWGGNSMSFMGKGVTKNAVICLLHLSHEMIAEGKDKDFISQWSLGHEAGSEALEEPSGSQLGLAWLIPLWVDRDPEVRFASLGVGSSLSSLPSGCHALCASCHNISGGLWGTLLNILLDPQESSMVRREAAFILQNLLVMPMPANVDEAKDSPWQNPCVHDEASGVSLVGLPALQALLYHCQFFQHVSLMASTCYRGRYTFPLQPSSPAPAPSAQDGQEAEDSLNLWRSCAPAAHNQSRACGSLSTSSTLLLPGGSRPHSPAATSPSGTAQDTPASRLMAQGQSDTDTSSVISQDSRPGDPSADTCAIVTPDLLSALCGLLHNLLAVLPDFTLGALLHSQLLQSLASLVDSSTIERCVSELRALHTLPGHRADVQSQVLTLLQYLSSCCRLLQTCVGISQELIGQADFLKPLLANVVAVLTLDSKDLAVRVQVAVHACWTDLLTLLATLVSRAGSVALPSVSAALGRRWQPFSDTLSVCVDGSDLPLHAAALHFLCVLLSAEANRRSLKVTATPPDPVTALSETLNGAPGGHMCELLLQSFEKRSLQDPLKMKTARALAALLACSPTAQEHAAKAGLIDSCVEQLKQRQAQLQLESVRPGRGGGAPRRKEESYMKEVKMAAEILRNCLYRNDECKAVATDARLAPVLQALWPWLLGDDAAMEAVLELLCVYTASCTAACSAVCSTGGVGVAPGPRGAGSLMHLVMRLASGLASDHSLVQRLAFSLLANLAVSRDCRGVLHKSHFLQGFLSVPVPKAGGGRAGGLLGLWLRLLVCVTQGEDGQLDVLRLNGALELLADVAQQHRHGNRPLAADAILILHNVCFCSANKPRLLANDKAMKVFLSCLDSKDTDIQSMGAAALWALLHNNQKAKTTLKCPSVRLLVDEAYAATKKDAEKRQDPMNTYLLKCLESLSQLLNS